MKATCAMCAHFPSDADFSECPMKGRVVYADQTVCDEGRRRDLCPVCAGMLVRVGGNRYACLNCSHGEGNA